VIFLRRGNGGREQQTRANGIELTAELRRHGIKGFRVLRTSGNHSAVDRILPIHVDAVEDSRSVYAWSEIPVEVQIHAGAHEISHMRRLSSIRKSFGVNPSANRNQDLQFGKLLLELLKLMKRAAQLIRVG